MAHDIYVQMYTSYGAYIFNNISESEQRHMDSVAKLISKYELDDTVTTKDPGDFDNTIIQAEYDLLLAKGGLSPASALEAGVEIEEMDINDIKRMLGETDKDDITRVLNNLLDGSYNHLDAFETHLGITP